MSVTIVDIADKAGVSTMTVSRVINNSGYVSEKTRARVEAVIKELNYRPNLMARGLINRKSTFVYVIVPDISNPFYADLTKGVEHVAHAAGYSIILSNAYWQQESEISHIEAARGRMAEGVILVLPTLSEQKILELSLTIPMVVVDKFIRTPKIDSIYIEQETGARQAVEHLISLGHRRIAFLSGLQIHNNASRRRGYEQALGLHNIVVRKELIFSGNFTFDSGVVAFEKMLELPPQKRPTALFAASDLMALGFVRSAFSHGYDIPGDLSVVGFDDITISSVTNPALTTVRHPFIKMGEAAMIHLLGKLSPSEQSSAPPKLQNTLIVRETTGPAPILI